MNIDTVIKKRNENEWMMLNKEKNKDWYYKTISRKKDWLNTAME